MRYQDRIAVRHDTVRDARRRVYDSLEDGIICPCCDQTCKEYPRKLNHNMAASLIWLVREYRHRPRWIHITAEAPRFVLKTKEYATPRHWGLMEARENDDPTKKTSGLWRPTQDGIDFVGGRIRVASHAFLYNNTCRGLSKETTTIEEALGEFFDYQELMNGRFPR